MNIEWDKAAILFISNPYDTRSLYFIYWKKWIIVPTCWRAIIQKLKII